MVTTIITIVCSALGGAGIHKLIQFFSLTKKEKIDTGLLLIQTLSNQVQTMDVRLNSMQKELDSYREKYYTLKGDYNKLMNDNLTMKKELADLKGEPK